MLGLLLDYTISLMTPFGEEGTLDSSLRPVRGGVWPVFLLGG